MSVGLGKSLLQLSLWAFLGLLLTPLLVLFFLKEDSLTMDSRFFAQAQWNTFFLALGVLLVSTAFGVFFAYCHTFFQYPFKKWLHGMVLLPLALPAYVLGFIYLGVFGSSTYWSRWITLQGELWFLIVILSLALLPYIYYFSVLGLKTLSQTEIESELLLKGGWLQFFRFNTGPKIFPFVISAQVLVVFETLSDFGAASVVNVPVMTTLIYKMWFDLFSFGGAVDLALKYSVVVMLLLVVEIFLKLRKEEGAYRQALEPVLGRKIPSWLQALIVSLVLSYVFLAFFLPASQIIVWSIHASSVQSWKDTLLGTGYTLALGASVGVFVVMFALFIHGALKENKINSKYWNVFSTIGYSVPGSLLAVSVYAILISTVSELSSSFLLVGLVMALFYKFLTVGMRPVGERFTSLSENLFEASQVMNVSFIKKWRVFLGPYLLESGMVALLLVMIEVMKEMPLTLMLAPGDFQTLSIKIFNFTSEGEWEKAALPSLMLLAVGMVSVVILNLREEKS